MTIPPLRKEERLARVIFHPYHVDSKGRLKSAAFRPPNGCRELSVLRLRLTSMRHCREHAERMEGDGKKFSGLATIGVEAVEKTSASVKISPTKELPMHADIVFSHVFRRGEPLPTGIREILVELVRRADYHPRGELNTAA